ncbi:sugar phosphate isomerase/epimerase [bacterium]|nr:sugar phosphate isomerase/epimerase [bacterium]
MMKPSLSIATDYAADTGDPSSALERIARAGFTHVHWCHHWCTDFIYGDAEVAQIGEWLRSFGLRLLDLHGSVGPEKNWWSPREHERLAGVELVANRLAMTARLGGDAVVMHVPGDPGCLPVRRSLDALEGVAHGHGVRIAIENGSFPALRALFNEYDPAFVGLCYDAGHGNLVPDGLDHLDALKDRLIALHLHDNDGLSDQHKPVFSGTVDWARLAGIIARSPCAKCINMEVGIRNAEIKDEEQFLAAAYRDGLTLAAMIADAGRPRPDQRRARRNAHHGKGDA